LKVSATAVPTQNYKKAVFTKHRSMTAFSEMPSGSRVDAQQLSLPNRGE
jgi:hypothetical protein